MTEVISVRFRGGCKTYYFDPRGVQVTAGEHVIVETAQGLEYAQCAEGNHEVPDEQVVEPFRPMVRIATDHDRRVLERNRAREKEAFDVCQKKILQHKLEMKLVRVECSFDGNKILFFFTADGRVDFRELVKDLASAFRARIELRQIGVRDEAKMLGGLGICGRPFCCAQFLDDFMPVSIKMAKTQSLSLNPTKISGTCGRLMCCLKYEQEAYLDLLRTTPKVNAVVSTPDGKGSREGIEIPKERPARYTEERQEEFPVPTIIADFAADREEPEEGRRRSRRRRGGKGSERPAERPAEKPAEKPEEKRREGNRRRRTRGSKPGASAIKPFAPQPDAKPVSRQESRRPIEDEGPSNKRPRHRGGRRRGGQGGGTPKTEA